MAVSAMAGEAHDPTEMNRMVYEKAEASIESVLAINSTMALQGLAFFRSMSLGRQPDLSGMQGEALAAAALKPYATRVRSNQRRLNGGKA
ncbi:hypothetical protein [Labrenzia sp. 011]|uniref:hypothetical protein n=1 Tax=Labrenzia sp. 011 TaxID=2171494 RepID=UPI001056FF1C|nr:hypothetical protein [Labrenzia sp. 011]